MKRKLFIFFSSLLVVINFGVTFDYPYTRWVSAQSKGFLTIQAAFESILEDYIEFTGKEFIWTLGVIKESENYAIVIAKSDHSEPDYEDYALLLAHKGKDGLWSAVAPQVVESSVYNEWLFLMPTTLLSEYAKYYYYQYDSEVESNIDPRVSPTHYFPWPIRQTARLTQKDGSTHPNQLDFVLRDSSDVYSSKPGVVVFVKEVSDTGGCNIDLWPYANMVVVQHGDSEYSWYVHLAQYSVPVEVGDQIGYGTKIGEQGNTGFACGSTGIHLHYMVSTEVPSSWPDPTVPDYAPWPPSGSLITVDFIEEVWSDLIVSTIYESQNAPPPGICNDTIAQAVFYDYTYCNSQIFQQDLEGLVTLELIGLDNQIESIALPAGWSIGLYKEKNEIGPAHCLNQTDQMLWDNQFSDDSVVANKITWFRLYQQADCPYPDVDGIKFFPEPNFGGLPVWGMVGARFTNGPQDVVGSIYIPGGYSAKIYDQDEAGGNSLCFASSVLNLADFGWIDQVVESVELIEGNSCENDPGYIPQPVLTKPLDEATVYGPLAPELCWQFEDTSQDYLFNVHIFNDLFSEESGWIPATCWTVENLAEQYGDYSWRVRAKNNNEDLGQWSLTNIFYYTPDTSNPAVQMIAPLGNSIVKRPKANLIASATDNGSGVSKVHFSAYYDDGTGYDWHYLGFDENAVGGWIFVWNLTVVESSIADVFVYAEDYAGNSDSILVTGIEVVDLLLFGDGFQYRGPAPEENDQVSIEQDLDEIPPQILEFFNNYPNPYIVVSSDPEETPAQYLLSNQPKTSAIIFRPKLEKLFLTTDIPELCWELMGGDVSKYQVKLSTEGEVIISNWSQSTCWQPRTSLQSHAIFEWQIRVKNADGIESPWSNMGRFVVIQDQLEHESDVRKSLADSADSKKSKR